MYVVVLVTESDSTTCNVFGLVEAVDTFVVHRFYLTLILHNLWKQRTIWRVSAQFQLPRGLIQQLLTSAASFAACINHFCQVRDLDTFRTVGWAAGRASGL